jgi:hypothetical protein
MLLKTAAGPALLRLQASRPAGGSATMRSSRHAHADRMPAPLSTPQGPRGGIALCLQRQRQRCERAVCLATAAADDAQVELPLSVKLAAEEAAKKRSSIGGRPARRLRCPAAPSLPGRLHSGSCTRHAPPP